jgi:hypothetical protein
MEFNPPFARTFPGVAPDVAGVGTVPISALAGVAGSSAVAERVDPDSLLVIESCHSVWLFDTKGMRFRRVLKGLDVEPTHASTSWRNYYRLEFDEGSPTFKVVLNAEGTRMLRSGRHDGACDCCDGELTSEFSLEELASLVGA